MGCLVEWPEHVKYGSQCKRTEDVKECSKANEV